MREIIIKFFLYLINENILGAHKHMGKLIFEEMGTACCGRLHQDANQSIILFKAAIITCICVGNYYFFPVFASEIARHKSNHYPFTTQPG